MSVLLLSTAAVGCKGLFSTVAYLVHGTDVPAAYDGLRNQRVAVVVSSSGRHGGIDLDHGARELAQKIASQLKRNVARDPRHRTAGSGPLERRAER